MNLLERTRGLRRRLGRDYGGSDRMPEYASLLRTALDRGYETMPLRDFDERIRQGLPIGDWLVLRHDVDIDDPIGNEAFFSIEQEVGARSTFYFRRSTALTHRSLIDRLLRAGFEVGYHFEEVATMARRRHLRTREAVLGVRDEIADMFRANCVEFRQRWNPDLVSVASHGDWMNRRLKMMNNEIITEELLAECGLRFEAYGPQISGQADVYVSDVATPPAKWAMGYGLDDALRDQRRPIYLLTHERKWHSNRRAAALADRDRIVDELGYRLGRR